MSATPAYQAATAGQPGNAGAVNQFLGSHSAAFAYGTGALQASQTTASTSYQSTAGQWLAQQFMTGASQTTIGQVLLQISDVGGSPTLPLIPVLTVSLYADSGGLPTGGALASATVNSEYVYSSGYWLTIPLVASGLTPGTHYQLVTAPAGTSSHYYTWHQTNQAAGAATSPDGATWTAAPFGLTYQVYDNTGTATGPTLIYEDNGRRWTQITFSGIGLPTQITEFTAGQTASGYLYSTRSIAYSNSLVTGVS